MKHVLAAENVDLLAQLAWSRVLLGFDFDGTLAPIVPRREEARLRPRTRQLLARVCDRYPCAVISGRSRADVRRRLAGVAPQFIAGNHGMEPGVRIEAFAALIDRMAPLLAAALAGTPGIEIENKRYSLSVHYRKSRQKREARAAIERAIAGLPAATRSVPGKAVVNVLPAGAPNKGDALIRLREEAGADTALFVGDDATDEDIFALDQPGRLMTIRIGPSRTSAARFYLRNQREIDDLLALLARCRSQDATG